MLVLSMLVLFRSHSHAILSCSILYNIYFIIKTKTKNKNEKQKRKTKTNYKNKKKQKKTESVVNRFRLRTYNIRWIKSP